MHELVGYNIPERNKNQWTKQQKISSDEYTPLLYEYKVLFCTKVNGFESNGTTKTEIFRENLHHSTLQ